MGTVCSAHLACTVREYAPNAENGAVTVRVVENPGYGQKCVYCNAPNEFEVSYYPKKEYQLQAESGTVITK